MAISEEQRNASARLRAISLFTGAGGFDLGFELSGQWSTVVVSDSHQRMIETLRANKGKEISGSKFLEEAKIVHGDIRDHIDEICQDKNIHLVLGGPPCQSFSAIGSQKGYSDSRGGLIFAFAEVVERVEPLAFLFENVPNMRSTKWEQQFQQFKEFLRFGGRYRVDTWLLNCANYGCSTLRERIFILGVKSDLGIVPTPPAVTHGDAELSGGLFPLKPQRTVRDALEGLPAPEDRLTFPFLHFAPKHEPEIAERFSKLTAGERDHIRRRNRLDPDMPALTLFAGGEAGGTRAHIHPWESRELTPRELARIHGFPDEYTFCGNKSQVSIQIANSVPIEIARAWAEHLAGLLGGVVTGQSSDSAGRRSTGSGSSAQLRVQDSKRG